MADFRVFKKKEWWRESGETPDSARRLGESAPKKKNEEYDLKRGDDGKNHPSITTKYAGKSKVEAPKKVAERVKKVRQIVEAEFDDEDEDEFDVEDTSMDSEGEGFGAMGDDDMDASDDMSDINPEDDLEMGDEGMGETVCTCPACGAKLVIETADEEEAEGEEFGGDDFGDDEGFESDEEIGDGMGVESEDKDMSLPDEDEEDEIPKLESKKDKFGKYAKKVEAKRAKSIKEEEREFEEAYASWKKERIRRIEALKSKGRKKLEAESEIGVAYGSDTSKVVKKGQTNSGSKTDVGQGNSDDFGIAPQDTKDMVRRGQTNSGSKTQQSEKKVMKRKPIAEEEQAAVTDPFEDEADADAVIGDDFANVPIEVGADPDSITKYKTVEARRKARKNSTLSESVGESTFNFKDLVRGIYK